MGQLARWCGVWLGALLFACGPTSDLSISSPFDVTRPELRLRPTGQPGVGVAFDGRQYFVVWEDGRTGNIFGARVTPEGRILDPAGIPLNLGTGVGGGEPRVAWDGTQFVVAWSDGGTTVGALVERDGDVRRHFILGPNDSEGGPLELACARKLCLVTWSLPGDGEVFILAARVDADGDVLDLQTVSSRGNVATDPTVTWDGGRFLVVWSDSRGGESTPDLYGTRVEKDGSVLEPGGVPLVALPGAQGSPAVTWTGSRFLLVWQDDRGGTQDIFGARLRRDLTVDGPTGFPISTAPGEQTEPRLAPSGSKSLVVWDDTRRGPHRAWGVRVGDDGRILGPSTGFPISSGESDEERQPAVAAGDRQFFVAWSGAESDALFGENLILGTRVRLDDTVKDSPALRFTRSAVPQDVPAAAFGESSYLVVYREVREGAFTLLATRVRPDGRRLGEPVVLPAGLVQEKPAVAWDGDRWLVVWWEEGGIRGARVSGSGALLDATRIVIAAMPPITQALPAVASNGDGFLVVWMDGRNAGAGDFFDIFGARVSSSGAVLDPDGFRVSLGPLDEQRPSVVATGVRYLVAWVALDYFSGPFPIASSLRGARVDADGTVLDTPDRLFSTGAVISAPPALAWDGTNTLVAWSSAPVGTDFPGLDVLATRVDADANVLDAPPITVAALMADREEQSFVTATFDGRDFWLAWQVQLDGADPPFPALGLFLDVYGARVRTDGTVRDPGGRALAEHQPEPEREPFLASSGDGRATLFYTEFITDEDVMNLRIQGRVLTRRGPSVLAVPEPMPEAGAGGPLTPGANGSPDELPASTHL